VVLSFSKNLQIDWFGFKKKSGFRAELSGKSSIQLLRFSKKLQIGWCGFKKKSGSGAGNYKKSLDQLLMILRKERHHFLPLFAQPTNNHQILRRSCAGSGIHPAKKSGHGAELYKKNSGPELRFQKKERIDC
jgi:hypothetical protein